MSAHTHDHVHDHTHAHDHDGDTYYLDQICMVGISGAFGAICLALYIMNATAPDNAQTMLGLLLGPQFHLFVLGSGIALVLVAGIRGLTLWRQAARPAHTHDHDHAHDHHHDHAHGDCGHEHAVCDHDHAHHHEHGPAHHHHDHEAADHDHGWAPWRYVLLLVPIILFLLGLPNKGPQAVAKSVHLDMTHELAAYAGMVASAPMTEGQLASWLAALYLADGEATEVAYKDLESFAGSETKRAEMKGKTVRVRGQFSPSPGSEHFFSLVRFRIQCCGADAIRLDVPMMSREPLSANSDLKMNAWVKVTGVVDFQTVGGHMKTVLRVPDARALQKCDPDNNPYIQ